ncbi:MAG: hypothetical protein IKS45_06945, partial [Thermoguttaceae bacterium]|nr:hypothetical protein [Thermoguttaceae bacterium]
MSGRAATYAGAYAVDFTFTAQSNTALINLLSGPTNNEAWHHYGVMLIETNAAQVKPTTPTIYNPSFEVDNNLVYVNNEDNGHGYLDNSNAGIISGWQFTNLTNTAMRAGLAWKDGTCKDFIGTQTPPDGNQLAWVQSGSNVDARLYQNVYGFDPTDKDTVYRVSMDLGGRTATGNPLASLFIGKDQATEKAYINSKEITKGTFKEYGAVFVPNSDVQTIAIRNMTSGDTSLLVDNVQLKSYSMTPFFSDNFNVYANATGANIGGPSDNDQPDRFSGGLLGPLSYTNGVAGDNQIQVGSNDYDGKCREALFFAVKSDQSQSHTSPDYNFKNLGAMTTAEEGGRMYDISFRVAPQFDEDVSSSNWAAVMFGETVNSRAANVNGSDGVGILFRRNGGVQLFDRNALKVDLPAGTFALTDDWADVRVLYYVPDFDGTSPVDVSLYVNGELITTYQTATGFTDNFIELEAYSANSDYKRSLMDDFVVKSSAELNYVVNRIQNLGNDWTPNGLDKRNVIFNAQREGSSEAVHTGALSMSADTEINVEEGLTLNQTGALSGTGNINKTGAGTLRVSGDLSQYEGDVNIYGGSVEFNVNKNTTFANRISDLSENGTLIKSGSGKLTLSDSLSTATTTVTGGTLSLESLSSKTINVQPGGTLSVGLLTNSPTINIDNGNFEIGNTATSSIMSVGNVSIINNGMVSFDMNDMESYSWDY